MIFSLRHSKECLVGMYDMNEKNNNIKLTGRTFSVDCNSRIISLHTQCQKLPLENTKDQVKIQSSIEKRKKRIPTRNKFVIVFARNFRCINPHAS